MPPTIHNENALVKRDRPEEKKSDLICRVKYMNTLPDIPFDLKFLNYPFDSARFTNYNPTSLESSYRYEVLTESDLGVFVDLVDQDIYKSTQEGYIQLDPADEKLLEEDIVPQTDTKRSRHHARNVSWLKRTEYISTEQTRFQPQSMDKVEAKVGYSVKRKFNNQTFYMDRDSQVKSIEKTFEDSLKPIKNHYSKPGVTALEVLPIFPDFELWKYPCAQVIFDSDPAPVGKQFPAQLEEMSQAMIRGVKDESGAQFVAYFLPTEETIVKKRQDVVENVPYQEDEEYEYRMAREYNWNVKSKSTKGYEENYFFIIRQNAAFYNELETRVRLTKRRQKTGQTQHTPRLLVKYRPLNEEENEIQVTREKQLQPQIEEDEEEEEDENGDGDDNAFDNTN